MNRGDLVIQLDGLRMFVSSTADTGVVGQGTRLEFVQRGDRVAARYSGGSVVRGWLVGRCDGETLWFRYAQRENGREIHGGQSVCDLQRLADGRVRMIEHFTWSTRTGSGINVFDEVSPER
jgi:hypothetical protein